MRVVAGTRPRLIGCRPFAPSPQLGEGRAAGSTAWRHRIDSGKRTLNRNASPVLDPPVEVCCLNYVVRDRRCLHDPGGAAGRSGIALRAFRGQGCVEGGCGVVM